MDVFQSRIFESDASASDKYGAGQGLFRQFGKLPTLKEANDALVAEALYRARNNQRAASAMLGITPSALNKRIKGRE